MNAGKHLGVNWTEEKLVLKVRAVLVIQDKAMKGRKRIRC